MPDISSNLGLNLPKGSDTFDYDVFLRQNFQKIDDQLKANITETFTASAGQTVVTLVHSYIPGAGALSVEVDGVPQYVGSGYTETDSNTITFTEGLNSGAPIKVTILGLVPANDERFNGIESSLADNANRLIDLVINVKNPPPPLQGAKGDGVADDTTAIQNIINYIQSNLFSTSVRNAARALYFPAGIYVISNTLTIDESIRVFGENRASEIRNTSATGADAIVYSNTKFLFNAGISNISIVSQANAGHGINFKYGFATCAFRDLYIFVQNPAKSCMFADYSTFGGGIYDSIFEGGEYFGEKWNRTAPIVDMTANGTLINENVFRNLRVTGSTTTQAIQIKNKNLATYLVNNRFENLNFETCAGGGLYLQSAKANTIANISFWDNPTYTNNLIVMDNAIDGTGTAGYASTSNILTNITRHGDALGAGVVDIFFKNSVDSVLMGFYPSSSAAGKIDFNSKRITVIGVINGTVLNDSNVARFSALDGLITSSIVPNTDITRTLGSTSKRFLDVYSLRLRPGAGTALWYSGAGSPEGRDAAPVGSLYTRTDGGAGTTLYVKETGTGNTGWVAK